MTLPDLLQQDFFCLFDISCFLKLAVLNSNAYEFACFQHLQSFFVGLLVFRRFAASVRLNAWVQINFYFLLYVLSIS